MKIVRIINVEPLPARMYNGLDRRTGWAVIETIPVPKPLTKKPWWKVLVGL